MRHLDDNSVERNIYIFYMIVPLYCINSAHSLLISESVYKQPYRGELYDDKASHCKHALIVYVFYSGHPFKSAFNACSPFGKWPVWFVFCVAVFTRVRVSESLFLKIFREVCSKVWMAGPFSYSVSFQGKLHKSAASSACCHWEEKKNKEESMVRGGRWWLSICPAVPLSRGCYWMWLFLSHLTLWLPAFSKSVFGERGKRQLLFIPFLKKKKIH